MSDAYFPPLFESRPPHLPVALEEQIQAAERLVANRTPDSVFYVACLLLQELMNREQVQGVRLEAGDYWIQLTPTGLSQGRVDGVPMAPGEGPLALADDPTSSDGPIGL